MDASILILSEAPGNDPRRRRGSKRDEEPEKTPTRVVLHRQSKRILVEIETGKDAVGKPCWRRIDNERRSAEVRGAYEAVERIAVVYFERTEEAERRVVEAERRIAGAESRALEAERRATAPRPMLPQPDPKAAERKRLTHLIALAGSSNVDEARNASLAAVKLMKELGLLPK